MLQRVLKERFECQHFHVPRLTFYSHKHLFMLLYSFFKWYHFNFGRESKKGWDGEDEKGRSVGINTQGKKKWKTKKHWQGEKSKCPSLLYYSYLKRSSGGEGGEEIVALHLSLECSLVKGHLPLFHYLLPFFFFPPSRYILLYHSFLSSLGDLNWGVLHKYPRDRGWKSWSSPQVIKWKAEPKIKRKNALTLARKQCNCSPARKEIWGRKDAKNVQGRNKLSEQTKEIFFTALMKLGNLIAAFFCHLLEDLHSARLLQERAMREETTNTFLSCWVYGAFGPEGYNKLVGANESEAGQNASFLKPSTVDATLKIHEKQL